ncbi:4-(cytidine 5'-diphospho)-2-C-methyl-D-erythritol kinase [bacterium]|nr:4-(cytidine 5'-diphospho)-2-C-methyl-D-erythritol kinase [bacterium]
MQRQVKVFAPAKINWALTIQRRRPDGFHDIHTIFQALEWGDDLVCVATEKDECVITCNDPSVPTGPNNLIARMWMRLRQAHPGRVGGMNVELVKRIPAGAGLGGGSSDATAALVAMQHLYDLRLGQAELEAHAAAIGSDCPFFLRGGTVLASGRGEIMRPIPNNLGPVWVVVVWPGFASPTAEAYGLVKPEHWQDETAVLATARALELGNMKLLQTTMKNIFSDLVVLKNLKYKKVVSEFENAGICFPRLSGSGSAMYGLARDGNHAMEASRHLGEIFPVAVAASLREKGAEVVAG